MISFDSNDELARTIRSMIKGDDISALGRMVYTGGTKQRTMGANHD